MKSIVVIMITTTNDNEDDIYIVNECNNYINNNNDTDETRDNPCYVITQMNSSNTVKTTKTSNCQSRLFRQCKQHQSISSYAPDGVDGTAQRRRSQGMARTSSRHCDRTARRARRRGRVEASFRPARG